MGYSSFIIPLTPNRTLENVLAIIEEHNALARSDEWNQVGEEIGDVQLYEVTTPYKKGMLRKATQVVSCGVAGGGSSTESSDLE